ncbi:hypothetical protein LIPSTDRAFT_172817 [Lipomyces starkeyi NRRL Y-11557]|uniref:Uncharacterized protein n=1 Tax=Lipomyces starkeyi NRRL Y-11557 TaxID=675824 RepID=A0A1E3PYL5_LIPST|nr:hypothetical protein LIPSTDRAFT_172817 [Lipomyces starkeyi NRRL Y-11557]
MKNRYKWLCWLCKIMSVAVLTLLLLNFMLVDLPFNDAPLEITISSRSNLSESHKSRGEDLRALDLSICYYRVPGNSCVGCGDSSRDLRSTRLVRVTGYERLTYEP